MGNNPEKPALLIIDMVKDNFEEEKHLPITAFAKKLIEPINALSAVFREQGWPVVFSTDSFHEDDFIFTGRMHPHSLAGTRGAEIVGRSFERRRTTGFPNPDFPLFLARGWKNGWKKEKSVSAP